MTRKSNSQQIADFVKLMGKNSKANTIHGVLDELEEAMKEGGGGGEKIVTERLSPEDWAMIFPEEVVNG